jgi:hypothetical protein
MWKNTLSRQFEILCQRPDFQGEGKYREFKLSAIFSHLPLIDRSLSLSLSLFHRGNGHTEHAQLSGNNQQFFSFQNIEDIKKIITITMAAVSSLRPPQPSNSRRHHRGV